MRNYQVGDIWKNTLAYSRQYVKEAKFMREVTKRKLVNLWENHIMRIYMAINKRDQFVSGGT